jgi:hypothetical protein
MKQMRGTYISVDIAALNVADKTISILIFYGKIISEFCKLMACIFDEDLVHTVHGLQCTTEYQWELYTWET